MFKKLPAKAPAAEQEFEAMAEELNARGLPYIFFGEEFLPGEWRPITAAQREMLGWCNWVKVRAKAAPVEAPDGS